MSQRLTRKRLIDIGTKVLEHQWAAIQQIAEDEELDEDTVVRALHFVMFDDALKERRKRSAVAKPTVEPINEIPEQPATEQTFEMVAEPLPRKRGRKKAKEKKGGGH
ncbi:MAG: hypothetical protein DI585_02895 [Pseudomonas fluorescens]|nr:MAG: hypothetical protein DI585_02895 [Pseudomonas fluorescens]